jgi:hypothetical protein
MLGMEKDALDKQRRKNRHHSQKMLAYCKEQAKSQDRFEKDCVAAIK